MAAEEMPLSQVLRLLPGSRRKVRTVLDRLRAIGNVRAGMRVLDIGAAQGRGLVELVQQGFDAVGVEPWEAARARAREVEDAVGVDLDIREGSAEALPFEDDEFDLVLASSVMEHVTDLEASLTEVHRVLRPDGLFWFNSASAMCPRQNEIRGFPLFGWYPDPLKKRLMHWATHHRPALVAHTQAPALHWWTNRRADTWLKAAGFVEVWTRWELRQPGEDHGLRRRVVRAVRPSRALQRVLDTVVPGCSYAARNGPW